MEYRILEQYIYSYPESFHIKQPHPNPLLRGEGRSVASLSLRRGNSRVRLFYRGNS
ncbi:MAG: hypothetical protein Q8S84_06800 [bacterium]|nr:hypothetical protein [bacterium]